MVGTTRLARFVSWRSSLAAVLALTCSIRAFAADAPPVFHPQGGYLVVNGVRLWYEQEGSGSPILLIPGGPGSSHLNFHPYFSDLAGGFRVIYVDLYGRGRSDRAKSPSEYSLAKDIEDVRGLIQGLALGPTAVYGFSYGGLVAQGLALKYPDLVSRLVLASTLYSGDMWQAKNENVDNEVRNQYPEVWERLQELRVRGVHSSDPLAREADTTPMSLAWFYNPLNASRLRRDELSSNPQVGMGIAGDNADFLVAGEAATVDFRTRLKDLQMPTLIVAGRYDRVFPPRYSLEFKRCAPQAEFVMFEESGHYPQIEERDRFFSVLRAFLAKK